MKYGQFFAGGSITEHNYGKVIQCPKTGKPILENPMEEKRRQALIRVYYLRANSLCWEWPPGSDNYALGEELRRVASNLQAFPRNLYVRSREAWAWGILGFVAGANLD